MEKYEDLPIGIDLGTSYSCIAVYRNSSVEIIPNEIGNRTTPSIVSFLDNEIFVGEQTEYLRLKEPKNKIYAVKRIIGRDFNDEEVQEDIKNFSYIVKNNNGRPQIEVNSNGIKQYSPEEISSKILEKLKQSAEIFLGKTISKVVITVPAYFTERQKQATKNAGEIAGLNVIKIINEPTAASLAYGFGKPQDNDLNKNFNFDDFVDIKEKVDKVDNFNKDNNDKNRMMDCRTNCSREINEIQKIIIFDLGGGTLDVTLLELEQDNIEIKAHSGKMHLGGEDFDNILLNYCIDKFKKKTGINLNDEKYIKQKNRLKEHCIKAKIQLSYIEETNIEVESLAEEKDLNIKITRSYFELLCDNKFKLCLEPIEDVLQKANEKKDDIDEIILVGGSTKIPKIQNILQEFFNNKKLNKRLNPDEAVAHGAAIEAAIIMGKFDENVTLLDVCPFSLGVALHNDNDIDKQNGRLMDKIIFRGSKLPIKVTNIFSPAHNYSNSIIIELYEGENKYVKDNFFLGRFKLENLPKKKREEIKVNITFEMDEDSILTVIAEEKENNSSNSIVVKNDKGGLSKNEIEEAIQRQKEELLSQDLGPAFATERNYKYEIKNLENQIINETQEKNLFILYQKLQNTIENFIYTFQNINTNYTLKEKLYFYLSHLFKVYSNLLNFKNNLSKEEKDDIILKVKNYLEIFSKKDTNYLPSLISKFINNDDEIFCDFCIQILSYYSQRGTEYYNNKDRKRSKHYFEEALSINKYFSVEERVKNDIIQADILNSIINNCKELINILKAESIEKHSKGFRMDDSINESDFINEEQKLDILDRFKEGLFYLKNPKRKEDKLLKAIYLANIIKLEYKIFGSNDYDTLLKMITECIELKGDNYTESKPNKNWYDEISKIKTEIENKKKLLKNNPKIDENMIKEKLKIEIDQINSKLKEGKIPFLFYILDKHKPFGFDDFNFNTPKDLENFYNTNKTKFMKKIKHIYNPIRFKGNKEEERKKHCIVKEISMIINNFDS